MSIVMSDPRKSEEVRKKAEDAPRVTAARAQSMPIDITQIKAMAARAPPGSMRLGMPIDEETFKQRMKGRAPVVMRPPSQAKE